MDAIKPEAVLQFLRELSTHVQAPTRLLIVGSIALIVPRFIVRRTDDIDVVDEVPAELRSQHDVLDDLAKRYGLRLTHFQSHYLPDGWEQRIQSIGTFDKLQVFRVDVYDVLIGKLFSERNKDRDDLRAAVPQLDRETLIRRVQDTTTSFRSNSHLLDAAKKNWFVLFGEEFPV